MIEFHVTSWMTGYLLKSILLNVSDKDNAELSTLSCQKRVGETFLIQLFSFVLLGNSAEGSLMTYHYVCNSAARLKS